MNSTTKTSDNSLSTHDLQTNEQPLPFSTTQIRHSFIRKVFAIVLVQLLITFGIVAIFFFSPPIKQFAQGPHGYVLYIVSFLLFMSIYLALVCSKSLVRHAPYNYLFLLLLSIAMGCVAGTIASFHDVWGVLFAIGITMLICLAAILFSLQKKFDFTKRIGIVFSLSLILVCFAIVSIIFRSHVLQLLYASLAAVVLSMILVINLQMVMGNRELIIDEEDYILAALLIYVNIVNLFLVILTFFNNS